MLMIQLNDVLAKRLLDLSVDTKIDDFPRDKVKGMWVQAVEYWSEDDGWWYDSVVNGFKGWADRTDFEIYCDLRFTYIDGRDMSWNEFWTEAEELGKYS